MNTMRNKYDGKGRRGDQQERQASAGGLGGIWALQSSGSLLGVFVGIFPVGSGELEPKRIVQDEYRYA